MFRKKKNVGYFYVYIHTTVNLQRILGQRMETSGKTKLFPIVGDPVDGVVSPPAINAWLSARNIDAKMVPMNIPAQSIDAFWDLLRTSETFLGCSVTYPHKQAAFAQVDTRTDRAARLGALNTVRRNHDGSLSGDATDGIALVQAITDKLASLAGRTAHVIGAGGGAGLAIVDAFCEAGITGLVVDDMDAAKQVKAIELIAEYWPDVSVSIDQRADILVDATPNGKSVNATSLFTEDTIKKCEVVCDIAGNLRTSQLLTTSEHVGKTIIEAQEMGQGQVEAQMEFLFHPSEISDAF